MVKDMSIEERFELIKRNTEEIIGEEDLKKLLKGKKQPVVYWGTAPTGKPHVGYMFPALKIADLLNAGFKVKILLADLHAALDNVPWPVLEKRYEYYKAVIPELLKAMGADTKNLEFVKGSDFQLQSEYMFDVLRESSFVSVHDATKAASEVVKMGKSPKLSGLIYPIMQNIDEVYLEADAQLGGMDQRKIMVLARENLGKLGYDSRIEILHPLIPGLVQGGKMSASVEESKIDLLADKKTVETRINKAYCMEGDKENGLLPFVKYVVMTIKGDKKEKFVIERPDKFGGNIEYDNYEDVEKDFVDKKLHPMDLKQAVAREINELLDVIRKQEKKLSKLAKEAYE